MSMKSHHERPRTVAKLGGGRVAWILDLLGFAGLGNSMDLKLWTRPTV